MIALSGERRFDGRCAIITGAGSGVGRATARAFAAEGAAVVVADLNATGGAETAQLICDGGGDAVFQAVDVRDETAVSRLVDRAVETFGRLDIMVNNAAVLGEWVALAEQNGETVNAVIDVNVKGVIFGMKHALRGMGARGGVIVNIASVQGFRVVYPGASLYAASKAAVIALTKAAAMECGPRGVRVVAIAPGPIDTPMLRERAGQTWPPPILDAVPLGRIGHADEVADAILWLASDAAAYITGAILPVDGGFLAP